MNIRLISSNINAKRQWSNIFKAQKERTLDKDVSKVQHNKDVLGHANPLKVCPIKAHSKYSSKKYL